MNEVVLHPERNFLDPRNPSSPDAYKRGMGLSVWKYIYDNCYNDGELVCVCVNEEYYFGKDKQELFNSIKHLFGA